MRTGYLVEQSFGIVAEVPIQESLMVDARGVEGIVTVERGLRACMRSRSIALSSGVSCR
jgi:hypothetical protein